MLVFFSYSLRGKFERVKSMEMIRNLYVVSRNTSQLAYVWHRYGVNSLSMNRVKVVLIEDFPFFLYINNI